MSRKFLRNTVLTLAGLLVANLAPAGLHATTTHTAAKGPGDGGGGNDPIPPCNQDPCVVRAL